MTGPSAAEPAESHLQTQMSSTKMHLEGSPAPPQSPSAAAYSPQQQPSFRERHAAEEPR